MNKLDPQSPIVTRRSTDHIATSAWFIGMLLGIALLLAIIVLVCIVKRNRGGKYAVHEREERQGRRYEDEDPGFTEYREP